MKTTDLGPWPFVLIEDDLVVGMLLRSEREWLALDSVQRSPLARAAVESSVRWLEGSVTREAIEP